MTRIGFGIMMETHGDMMDGIDDIDWAPRPPTSRVPIFCEVCRKQGRVDRERQTITGATMPLLDFLAGGPRVCMRCKDKVSFVRARP